MEKKYVGNGKKSNFGVKVPLSLNKIFEHIYKDTKDNEVLEVFNKLKEIVKKADMTYISVFTPEGGKENLLLKLEINERKEPDQYGKTHNVILDEWVPDQNKGKTTEEPIQKNDDLPF